MSDRNGVLLTGLDGSNPLAFLAALGTLRTLTVALPDEPVRMSWEQHDGAWRPRVIINQGPDGLLVALVGTLASDRKDHPASFVGREKEIDAFYLEARRGELIECERAEWIAALTSDIHPNATSQLQLPRRDYFSGNLDNILAKCNAESLRRALFESWRYQDMLDGQSLHLEPGEDRRHAYQWDKPSGDPNRKKRGNVLGANRLALEALPLFLALPSSNPDRLRVLGWTGVRSDDSRWTWPIWNHPITSPVVKSLMAMALLQEDKLDRRELKAFGVVAAYRCWRILVEKTPNLTPSRAV